MHDDQRIDQGPHGLAHALLPQLKILREMLASLVQPAAALASGQQSNLKLAAAARVFVQGLRHAAAGSQPGTQRFQPRAPPARRLLPQHQLDAAVQMEAGLQQRAEIVIKPGLVFGGERHVRATGS